MEFYRLINVSHDSPIAFRIILDAVEGKASGANNSNLYYLKFANKIFELKSYSCFMVFSY